MGNRSYYVNICENGPAKYNKTMCTDKVGQKYFCTWDSTTPGAPAGNKMNIPKMPAFVDSYYRTERCRKNITNWLMSNPRNRTSLYEKYWVS